MPRPGAVTRSMTRAGVVTLHSTFEQEAAKDALAAAITVSPITAATRDITMHESPSSKPSSPSSLGSESGPSSILPADILHHNRMTILRLEQDGILAPGILTIDSSGELCTELSVEPDVGTMAGLFPNMAQNPNFDEQIPSWLRDYLIKILNVHGHGPPALCRAFYDHLKDSQGDVGINNSVRTAESHLSYAAISLRYAVEEVQDFLRMQNVFRDTYDEESFNLIKTVKRLVGYEGETMPKDLRLLIEIASMGTDMKEALNEPLQNLVVTPYTQLLEKLELISKALRMRLDCIDQETEKEKVWGVAGPQATPDSGIGGYWT